MLINNNENLLTLNMTKKTGDFMHWCWDKWEVHVYL